MTVATMVPRRRPRLCHDLKEFGVPGRHRQPLLDLKLRAQRFKAGLAVDHDVIEKVPANTLLKANADDGDHEARRDRLCQEMGEEDGTNSVFEGRACPTCRLWRGDRVLGHREHHFPSTSAADVACLERQRASRP